MLIVLSADAEEHESVFSVRSLPASRAPPQSFSKNHQMQLHADMVAAVQEILITSQKIQIYFC